VPAGLVTPLLRDEADTFIGINEDMLLMMPDQATQIKCVIYGAEFPSVTRAMKRDHPTSLKFSKTHFNDAVQRMLNLVKADRAPLLTMLFGNEEMLFKMADPEVGYMEDAIEVPGQCMHAEHEILMSPDRIAKAIISSPTDLVALHYEPGNPKAFIRIEGGDGYEAWVAPRTGVKKEQE
jgi:DNA polymerase III sliding clamp (beta) subunit (PCNA family)